VGRGMLTSLLNLCLNQTGLFLPVLGAEHWRVPTSTVDGLAGSLQVAQLGRCGQRCQFGNDAKVASEILDVERALKCYSPRFGSRSDIEWMPYVRTRKDNFHMSNRETSEAQ
jgi:hypothetical protein